MTSSPVRNLPSMRVLTAILTALLVLLVPLANVGSAHAEDAAAPSVTPTPGVDPAAAPTAATTPAAAAVPAGVALGDRVLRRGDTGDDVSALQKLLRVKQTSTYDVRTRKAVQRAQRAAGIPAHGVVGPKTLKAIQKAAAKKARAAKSSRSLPRAGTPAGSRAYARVYIAGQHGWGAGQMSCLSAIWSRESGWRYTASNPNGRYHGIPQTSSSVWRAAGYSTSQYLHSPAVQIKVGVRYIKSRYGTPCRAWSFWRSHHWY